MKSRIKLRWIIVLYCLSLSCAFAKETLSFDLRGVQGDLLTNVQARLNAQKEDLGEAPSADEIMEFYKAAPQEIRKALEPYGFFKANVQSRLKHQDAKWDATFIVDLGSPLRINKIDLQLNGPGKENKKLQTFIAKFPMRIGDVLVTQKYEQAKDQLFQIANNQGYVKAFLEENKILVNLKKNEADIIIHFQTGQQFYFGTVHFETSIYDQAFLQRMVSFTDTQPFSSQKLIEFQQALSNSYYFRQVVATPDFNHIENNRIPINVLTQVPKSQRYTVGLGYGSATGPRLTAGVNLRRTTDSGQHFDAQLKYSSVLYGLAAKYYIPGKNPLTDQWLIGADVEKFSPQNGESFSKTLTGGYSTKINNFQINSTLNYLLERYYVQNQPEQNSELLYPNLTINYVKANDLINPSYGKSLSLILQGSSKNLLSSASFIQGKLSGKYIFSPLTWNKFILRGDFGYTIVHDLNDLPLTLRYFAGGPNSIRGYNESYIGPGRYLEVGSIEYRNKIYGNLNGAVFFDMGTATDHLGTPLSKSEGIGLVYDSILGPIRLYVARAISKRDQPHSIEFSIGPEF